MSMKSLFLFGALCGVGVSADLRAASQPRAGFAVRQREQVKFVSQSVIYMEPSDFNYQGLKNQRNGGGYDNFLRSNIDNEQDKRNFNNEAGRDMLPFRSYEGAPTDASNTVQTKIPDGAPGPVITATPGTPVLYPLRWNNPHASELEVNVWIMNVAGGPVVVPIRKPACSGEGHQDNVFAFTVPTNFNDLGTTIPGFTGCKKEGDCALQVYAHSVEPRTYSIGVPIVITGTVAPATATSRARIEPARQDVGLNVGALPNQICVPSTSPAVDIPTAVPRAARLVSDVFNHAYQNSDYSPYSGQQPEAISQNLQASSIISMIPANRGELGKALLQQKQPAAAAFAANLRNKVDNLVKKYEGLTNKIIAQIGDKVMKTTGTEGENGVQKLANCFRCAEVGAVTTTRLTTNTYVPSFQLPPEQVQAAKNMVPNQYKGLISDGGIVQIYKAVLNDMAGEFRRAASMGLTYQPAVTKASMATMADATQFRKRNANGQNDNGVYAATQAQVAKNAAAAGVSQTLNVGNTPLMAALSADEELPDIGTASTVPMDDANGYNMDSTCDDDLNPTDWCAPPQPLFAQAADGTLYSSASEDANQPITETSSSSTPISMAVIIGAAAGAGVLVLLITAAIIKHRRSKQHSNTVTYATNDTTCKV